MSQAFNCGQAKTTMRALKVQVPPTLPTNREGEGGGGGQFNRCRVFLYCPTSSLGTLPQQAQRHHPSLHHPHRYMSLVVSILSWGLKGFFKEKLNGSLTCAILGKREMVV